MISVYHLNPITRSARQSEILLPEDRVAQAQLDWDARKYELVADILSSNDPSRGLLLTSSVVPPWWQNTVITPRFIGFPTGQGCRATGAGDIVKADHAAFLVLPIGFSEIELP